MSDRRRTTFAFICVSGQQMWVQYSLCFWLCFGLHQLLKKIYLALYLLSAPLFSPATCYLCLSAFGAGQCAVGNVISEQKPAACCGWKPCWWEQRNKNSKTPGCKTKTKSWKMLKSWGLRGTVEWVIIICGSIIIRDHFHITHSQWRNVKGKKYWPVQI